MPFKNIWFHPSWHEQNDQFACSKYFPEENVIFGLNISQLFFILWANDRLIDISVISAFVYPLYEHRMILTYYAPNVLGNEIICLPWFLYKVFEISSQKTRTFSFHIVNIMTADDLAPKRTGSHQHREGWMQAGWDCSQQLYIYIY